MDKHKKYCTKHNIQNKFEKNKTNKIAANKTIFIKTTKAHYINHNDKNNIKFKT